MTFTTVCVKCKHKLERENRPYPVCPSDCNSIVKNVYASKRLILRDLPGIWRYGWLPVKRPSGYAEGSVTYKSRHFSKALGLENLYISFTGFWPEIKAHVVTGTFKELEAVLAIQYARENGVNRLVTASAGSAARAFAYIASREKYHVVLVVPEKVTEEMAVPMVDERYVKMVAVRGDYCDALTYADKLHRSTGIAHDGGGRNPARRDALGTILLGAVEKIGLMPDHYFQAISSGAGAIATFETAERLLGDGRFGKAYPRIHISQNEPFTPMVKAWAAKRRTLEESDVEPENVLDAVYAKVLSNKNPLYGLEGGVFDALQATAGEAYGVTNRQAEDASGLFQRLEGIDLHPAAAVAAASLIKAVDQGRIGPKETVMLNVSGGGLRRAEKELGMQRIPITIRVEKETPPEELEEILHEDIS